MRQAYHTPLLGWTIPSHDPYLDATPISSPPMPGSPYSPNPENFHFPILSADGHLLPPAPASAARSELLSPVPSERPLPSPPMETSAAQYAASFMPQRGYAPVSQADVVGLWPEQLHGDIGQANIRAIPQRPVSVSPALSASPRLSPGLPYLQPQTATIHHSFSFEGEGAGHRNYRMA